jgi:hypothetical protein
MKINVFVGYSRRSRPNTKHCGMQGGTLQQKDHILADKACFVDKDALSPRHHVANGQDGPQLFGAVTRSVDPRRPAVEDAIALSVDPRYRVIVLGQIALALGSQHRVAGEREFVAHMVLICPPRCSI